ncbi:MAG: chloride channel protein [Clostridiales bacterium]|nr:chloride channel protein [Clostridiales bacterium]
MRWLHTLWTNRLLQSRLHAGGRLTAALVKWIAAGAAVGAAGGLLGAAFHHAVTGVTALRQANPWLLWLLPAGGVVTALAYQISRTPLNVNLVLRAVRSSERIPPLMAPLIFFSTTVTQLVGGSAGKEGAALQMGGALGYQLARLLRLDRADTHVLVMCGMSALFSAVFLTPLTAALFAIEVISVGVFYFAALVPCLTAALTAAAVARALGVTAAAMPAFSVPAMAPLPLLGAALVGVACAAAAILFCICIHYISFAAHTWVKNDLLRAVLGGLLLIGMTFAAGSFDYNGTGMPLVVRAVGGQAAPAAFLLKLVFTAVTIAAGLRGGEIVPTMAIGATLGCTLGTLLGLEPGFCAAMGLTAMFCGMVNCPVTSMFLGLELFGADSMIYIAAACCISFVLSGNYSLYTGQKLPYSKIRAEYTNASAHN